MDFVTETLTVFAVLVPGLHSDWTEPLWIVLAAVCLYAWVLIARDVRRSPDETPGVREARSPAPTRVTRGVNTLVF